VSSGSDNVIGLPESSVLARLAEQSGVSFANATRLLRAIARADDETTESILAWIASERMRAAQAAKEKADARTSAITAARAARKDSGT
jgi:hypothetical protein